MTYVYLTITLIAIYAVPVTMLILWNGEKPSSHEVDAVEPKAAKQQPVRG